MKKLFFFSLIIGSSLLFAACSQTGLNSTSIDTGVETTEKSGETVKTGLISQKNQVFYLEVTGQTPIEIESYNLDLAAYIGQTVTVTGKYSGDTLFISQIN